MNDGIFVFFQNKNSIYVRLTLFFFSPLFPFEDLYCNYTWDSYLCWPPTQANTIIRQPCPPINGIDVTSKYDIKPLSDVIFIYIYKGT